MKTETIEKDWVSEVGAPAYASIAEMVAALQCDYTQLETLRDLREGYEPDDGEERLAKTECKTFQELWVFDNPDDAAELAELEAAAGDCDDEDDARERIQEDPLSLRIFGERIDGEWQADRFELLLTTGGPAVRIMGELNDHNEPDRAWLEVQDWGKPWTQYFPADQDVLLAYCSCFCFE